MVDVWFWVAAITAAVSVGLAKGGLSALGVLAVPVLSLVMSPVTAAGLLLPVYIVSDVFGVWTYRRNFHPRVLKIVSLSSVLGIGLGWLLASVVPSAVVTIIVGVIGVLFALNFLLRRGLDVPAKPIQTGPGVFWGTIAGFTSFVSHAGAPPFQMWVVPLKLDKLTFAGTATIAFAIMNAVKMIPYIALGQVNVGSIQIAAILCVPAVLSVWVGIRLVKILPEAVFWRFVVTTLGLVSLKLIYDGIAAL